MWLVVILEWSVLRCVCKRGSCQFLKRKNIIFKYIPVYIFTMCMMPVKVHLQVRVVLNLQYWVFHYSKVAIDVHAHYTPKCLTSCFKNQMQSFSQYLTTHQSVRVNLADIMLKRMQLCALKANVLSRNVIDQYYHFHTNTTGLSFYNHILIFTLHKNHFYMVQ